MRSSSFLALPALAAILPAERAGAAATGFAIRDFSGIALGTGAQMQVRVGPTWSVRAESPAAVLATMRISRDGNTLKVERRGRRAKDDSAAER